MRGSSKMLDRVVYPGSFDPVTKGHLNIIKRASKIFDEVIVAVFQNPNKDPIFSMEERVELLKETTSSFESVKIDSFTGLTTKYVKSKNASAILRGLRAVSDFEGEFQMASMNKELDPDIETIFLMTDSKYAFLAQFGGEMENVVPKPVEKALLKKYNMD
jgi:pantetheine-phosphate adenylyltransferase